MTRDHNLLKYEIEGLSKYAAQIAKR